MHLNSSRKRLIYEQKLKEINIICLTFVASRPLCRSDHFQIIGEESPDTLGQHSG